jgi:hypothetical protein
MGYKMFEHELTAIESLHNKRGILHVAQMVSAALATGSVVAMVVLVLLGDRLSSMTWQMGMALGGFTVAAGAWCWKRRLKSRLEALTHRIKLRGESGG